MTVLDERRHDRLEEVTGAPGWTAAAGNKKQDTSLTGRFGDWGHLRRR